MNWLYLLAVSVMLLCGCATLRRYYDEQWEKDGVCIGWCAAELRVNSGAVLGTRCSAKDCTRPCTCQLLGPAL